MVDKFVIDKLYEKLYDDIKRYVSFNDKKYISTFRAILKKNLECFFEYPCEKITKKYAFNLFMWVLFDFVEFALSNNIRIAPLYQKSFEDIELILFEGVVYE